QAHVRGAVYVTGMGDADGILEIAARVVDARERLIGDLATHGLNGQDRCGWTRTARDGMFDGTLYRLHPLPWTVRDRGEFTDSFENGGDVKIPILPTTALD